MLYQQIQLLLLINKYKITPPKDIPFFSTPAIHEDAIMTNTIANKIGIQRDSAYTCLDVPLSKGMSIPFFIASFSCFGLVLIKCITPSLVGRNNGYVQAVFVLDGSVRLVEQFVLVEVNGVYVNHFTVLVHGTGGTAAGREGVLVVRDDGVVDIAEEVGVGFHVLIYIVGKGSHAVQHVNGTVGRGNGVV